MSLWIPLAAAFACVAVVPMFLVGCSRALDAEAARAERLRG